MSETIALASRNFVDGPNEDKVFDNVQSTFWKPEHCNTDMERNYMKSINVFDAEKPVVKQVEEPAVEKKRRIYCS